MKIDKIAIQKNNKEKVNIYVDGKYSFSLSINGFLDSGLKEGDEITNERIDEMKSLDAPKLALIKAADIVSYSMKTENELIRKLRDNKFDDDAINYAVSKMKEYGCIDDESYVSTYITSKAIPNGWGEQKIISMLLKKGVDMKIIKDKLNECFGEEIKEKSAFEIAQKYILKIKTDDKRKNRQKLYQYLASKGFSYDVIKKACSKVLDEEYYEE